jgi:alanyl-tRNA synthetase
MKSAREIREAFLAFFERHGHRRVRSSSLVPGDDPTLLFTNAGMVQFKNVFTGVEKRDYRRAATSQKCLRVSGKHNDLENVGRTARHHTFFEMLGNFSFGDYFKREAIDFGWEFVTKEMGIPKERLAATVFRGEQGLPADDEARALWARYVPEDRIYALGKKDNFWSMGPTGPCGPCSEIHFHIGDDVPCAEPVCQGVACDCDRWIEIWNLVFMQFDAKADGSLVSLPAPSVDTGMGLERVAAIAQGKRSNYDCDLFATFLGQISDLSRKPYGRGAEDDVSMRVIADHSRATAFLIADGVLPSNEGRGYVLRRIMRRAIRHGKKLGLEDLFLHRTALMVADAMGPDYPELLQSRELIDKVAAQEESRFRQTIDQGLKLLAENREWGGQGGARVLPGRVAFQLYDTYGFPLDLIEVIGREQRFEVDHLGFEAEMEKQRERSRAASAFGTGLADSRDALYREAIKETGGTHFLGYETTVADAEIVALLVEGKPVEVAPAGAHAEVIAERTPFYGESGGQVGDSGWLEGDGFRFEVQDTQKPMPELIVHRGRVESGEVRVGAKAHFTVDRERRQSIRLNHSATHLAHWALRTVLGDHVKQKGSLVAPDRLRFDFSHFDPIAEEQLAEIEERVNLKVRENWDVAVEEMPIEAARRKGAIAMFGEKYGDVVRVVTVAPESIELCGGTHVLRSGDIGFFTITRQEGVASGVRRVEAVTGLGAVRYVRRLEHTVKRLEKDLGAKAEDLPQRVEELHSTIDRLEKKIDSLQKAINTQRSQDVMSLVREVAGVKVLALKADTGDPKALREFADKLRDRLQSGVLVVGGAEGDKVALVAMVTPDLTARFHAGKIIGEVAKMVGGRGGGRPEMAQAGGTQPGELAAALEKVYALVGG